MHCVVNFPVESQFLQAGVEAGANKEPSVKGQDYVEAGWPPSNETWHSWKKAEYYSQTGATCLRANANYPQWLGSLLYGAGKTVCG